MQFKASQWPSAMALQTKCCGPRPAAAAKQVRGSHGEPTKFVVVRPDKHGSPRLPRPYPEKSINEPA
jgi:hypothetical protein